MLYTDEQLEQLWEELDDVMIDYSDEFPDGALVDDWFIFMAGTDRIEVWDWFDEHYSKGVVGLMFKNG